MAVELTAGQARRIALWRQGLLTTSPAGSARRGAAAQEQAVIGVLHRLGAVQLDTISVLARSHELIAYARLGAVDRQAIERAYWSGTHAFEYWSHAACILPMQAWPLFAFRRREFVRRGVRWHEVSDQAISAVRERLASDGPLTTTDIGGAKRGGPWWDWSQAKVAVEFLLDTGEVACTRRRGWRRVYDLAERVVPEDVRTHPSFTGADGVIGPADDECRMALVGHAAGTIGVGTSADIADVHRLKRSDVDRHAADAGLIEVRVTGWGQRAWATREALDWLGDGGRARHRTTLLSPFDSLIWYRDRAERLFGMTHRLEAYTPAARRVHGYFAMPVLHRGSLVARVDPKRASSGSTVALIADRVTFEVDARGRVPRAAIEGTARALHEAAGWIGAGDIRIGTVVPASASAELMRAVSSRG
ncbi:MAG: winged helix DNA-binding domain-containing protein [Actinomycetales bacterium]|nr:winged helix DNA-binding domain-containing protein [Actinomycetales bacterium]